MAAIIIEDRMPQLLDARGLGLPAPRASRRARRSPRWRPGETLIVLATDPEAPVDIGALAADAGHAFRAERERRARGGSSVTKDSG